MKNKLAGLLLAIAAIGPAYAGNNDIEQLAEFTGLSERKVQMILGCRTCYAGYAYTYHRSLKKFQDALGEQRYQQLMSGQPIMLDNGVEVHVAMIDVR